MPSKKYNIANLFPLGLLVILLTNILNCSLHTGMYELLKQAYTAVVRIQQ